MLINQQDTQRRTSCNALASNLELPIEPEMLRKYAAPVPRYTSYPTAAHFTPEVEHETYGRWLSALPEASRPILRYAVLVLRVHYQSHPTIRTCVEISARSAYRNR
ncbi:MAG: hypothetical protein P8Y36_07730 [Alphaproteobacteria bacterium]